MVQKSPPFFGGFRGVKEKGIWNVTRRDSFLVLNLRLDVLDSVIRLDVQGYRLSREGLDENLHGTTSKSEDKMEGGLLLNVVV